MRTYRRITYEDRCHIEARLQANNSISEIATLLNFHKSSISREIARHSTARGYSAKQAQEEATKSFRRCRKPRLIRDDVLDKVRKKMKEGWSPRQIDIRYKLEGKHLVSHQTIYNFIKKRRSGLHKYLRRYNKRGLGRTGQRKLNKSNNEQMLISNRCDAANTRSEYGHWERDTLYISNRHQLLVLTERKSRYTLIEYVGKATGEKVREATEIALKRQPKAVLTMTSDNGAEFRRLGSEPFKTYKCRPYKPQERGSVENAIGLIRQYISTKTKPEDINRELLNRIEETINFRPRKIFSGRAAYEMMFEVNVALAS